MTSVKVLVEQCDGLFIATVRDDIGDVARGEHRIKSRAIEKARIRAEHSLGDDLQLTINDLTNRGSDDN